MSKVLVLGDHITDIYRHFTATRLCPEAPCPVLVNPANEYVATDGGAGLVDRQLAELLGRENVVYLPGSQSEKERIFADGHLVCRIDRDRMPNWDTSSYQYRIFNTLSIMKFDAVVISDYEKGAITSDIAYYISREVPEDIPIFVDAKNEPGKYRRLFALFPNEKEPDPSHVPYHCIRKLGARGCYVDGTLVPQERTHAVRDTTGAGDTFLAAFVYQYLNQTNWLRDSKLFNPNIADEKTILRRCGKFANLVAGISVEHIGTHVVTKEEIDKYTDS